MLIDWFTVSAQVINFLILVWLLKRFLYKPILRTIDERENRITKKIEQAAELKFNAQKEIVAYKQKQDDFDKQKAGLLQKVEVEALEKKQQLFEEVREEYELLRAKQSLLLENERLSLSQELVRCAQIEVYAISRKTLKDLSSTSLEERIVEVFIQRLGTLKPLQNIKSTTETILVHSAFDLTQNQKNVVMDALKTSLGHEAEIRFEIKPGIIGGIEVAVGGSKLSWSIADYLSSLEQSVKKTLDLYKKTTSGDLNHVR